MENKQYTWMVCVKCFTFNHAPYIADALNGFTMQQTDFPFVCVIVDDASTDGEPKVIREYLQNNFDLKDKSVVRNKETDDYILSFAQHKTNKKCYFAVLLLKYNHYSIKKTKIPYFAEWHDDAKYIALCEGDDYWVDSAKLQNQAMFLERNSDFGLCHTNFKCQKDDYVFPTKQCGREDFDSLVLESGVGTLTAMYRTDLFLDYIKEIRPETKGWKLGDAPLWIYIAAKKKIKYFTDVTSVYRILKESASHSKRIEKLIEFRKSSYEARNFMLFHLETDKDKRGQLQKKLFEKKFVLSIVSEYAGNGFIKKSFAIYKEYSNIISIRTNIDCLSHILYGAVRKTLKLI